jgi:hypothetical protein
MMALEDYPTLTVKSLEKKPLVVGENQQLIKDQKYIIFDLVNALSR